MSRQLRESVRAYRKFNRKDPRKVRTLTVDPKTPLIRVGEVPEVIYLSDKEGKKVGYRHKCSRPFPVMFADPKGRYFIVTGGNMKISDWLRG